MCVVDTRVYVYQNINVGSSRQNRYFVSEYLSKIHEGWARIHFKSLSEIFSGVMVAVSLF